MNLSFKRPLAIVLVYLMLILTVPGYAFAQTDLDDSAIKMYYPDSQRVEMLYPEVCNSSGDGTSAMSEETVDINELYYDLLTGFMYCPESPDNVDISKHKIAYNQENIDFLCELIWYHMPEAFHIYGLGFGHNRYYITGVYASYYDGMDTYDTYMPRYVEMVNSANILLAGVEGNDYIGDVEKALILHDRLADWNEYDNANYEAGTIPPESHCAYGALARGVSVCDGYAQAYMYLLNRVGIENRYSKSDEMNHGWNIVYIDGVAYNVDVTHDDGFNIEGKIGHDNFLVSTEYYKNNSSQHNVSDLDTEPQDTRYEDYFWHNSITEIQLIGDAVYYVDNKEVALKKYKNGTITKLRNIYATYGWYFTGYPTNQACLSSVGNELLFTSSSDVYAYDVNANTTTKIFSPTEVANGKQIYGFNYEGGYLVCYLSPDLTNFTVQKMLYDKDMPTAALTATNDVSASQTVTIVMADNAGIAGYYWGMSSDYTGNVFVSTAEKIATETVTRSGIYYLTVKDTSGNISETYTVTFYNTVLVAIGGEVAPQSVLTMSGNSFAFPTATRSGYTCEGWATDKSAQSGVASLTPTEDSTYYAVWKLACGDIDGDTVISSADLVALQQHILSLAVIENINTADMNLDGVVDSADLVIMQHLILAA